MTSPSNPWLLIDGGYISHLFAQTDYPSDYIRRRISVLRDRFTPEHTVMCWDSDLSHRATLFPAYKSDRKERSEQVVEAFRATRDVCNEIGVPIVEVEGFESDDIMATLSTLAKEMDRRSILYSNDRDLRQLLCNGWVVQLTNAKGYADDLTLEWYNEAKLLEDTGIAPDQWVDFMCLCGGKNGVPSVTGVGPKAAIKLLSCFGSIEGFLADHDPSRCGMSETQTARTIHCQGKFQLWRQLHTLNRGVEIRGEWIANVMGDLNLA